MLIMVSLGDWSLIWDELVYDPMLVGRGWRRQNFVLGRNFKFLLGQKFVRGHIRCKYSYRILNAKQIPIFLKVCIAKFVRQIFEYVFVTKPNFYRSFH